MKPNRLWENVFLDEFVKLSALPSMEGQQLPVLEEVDESHDHGPDPHGDEVVGVDEQVVRANVDVPRIEGVDLGRHDSGNDDEDNFDVVGGQTETLEWCL